MKPTGVDLFLSGNSVQLQVRQPDRVVDAIWDAVEEATTANMEPRRFMHEVQQAWDYYRKQQAKDELSQLERAARKSGDAL